MDGFIECELRKKDTRKLRRNEEVVGKIFLKAVPRIGENLEIFDPNAGVNQMFRVGDVTHVGTFDEERHKVILYLGQYIG